MIEGTGCSKAYGLIMINGAGGTVPTLKHSAPSKTGETVRYIIKLQIFRIIYLAGRAGHRKIPT